MRFGIATLILTVFFSTSAIAGTRLSFAMNAGQDIPVAKNGMVELWASCVIEDEMTDLLVLRLHAKGVGATAVISSPIGVKEIGGIDTLDDRTLLIASGAAGDIGVITRNLTEMVDPFVIGVQTGEALIVTGALGIVNPPSSLTEDCYLSINVEKAKKFKLVK